MRRVIASADRWIHLVSMRTVDVESVSYAICHDLLNMRLMRSGPIDLQVIDLLIDAHERVGRRPMDERCLESEDVCGFVIDSPEVAELLDVLDRYVPDTARSSSFSNTIVLNLMYELRYRTDGADTCVDGLLASYYGVRATGEVAARIHAAAERLDRIFPKWQLNGWSMAELAGREGADLPAIETLEQEYDEPSGYVTVEVTDEHTDPWAFDVERDLWKPLSMNERSARLAVDLFEKDEVYEKYYENDPRADGLWVECDEENEAYLDEYGKWLKDAGTSQKAIEEHKTTMYAFLYFFVAHRMELPMRFGAYLARSYLGSYYISNALESSPASMRRIAESMEMFYQCMLEAGHVQQEDYDFLVKDMDEHLDEWCSLCDLMNNPDWRYYVR